MAADRETLRTATNLAPPTHVNRRRGSVLPRFGMRNREREAFSHQENPQREKKILIIIKKKRKRREIKQSEVVMFLLWREGVAETPPPLKSIKT